MAALHQQGGPSGLPLALIGQAIPELARSDLVALTERLIDALDSIEGDPDPEDDDPAGQCDEDELNCGTDNLVIHGAFFGGPGCYFSDGGN